MNKVDMVECKVVLDQIFGKVKFGKTLQGIENVLIHDFRPSDMLDRTTYMCTWPLKDKIQNLKAAKIGVHSN